MDALFGGGGANYRYNDRVMERATLPSSLSARPAAPAEQVMADAPHGPHHPLASWDRAYPIQMAASRPAPHATCTEPRTAQQYHPDTTTTTPTPKCA